MKARSGLSYRALERKARRAGDQLPTSTVAGALNRVSLPSEEIVAALVRACGGGPETVEEWVRTRRALAVREQSAPATDSPGSAPGSAPEQISDPADDDRQDRDGATGRQLVPCLLPPDLSLFVGREDELAEACRLLDQEGSGPETLLVTGPAGVGKTALAVRTGHLLAPRFPDGQLYVDLRGFGDDPAEPFTVLGAFLRALGVPGGAVPTELTSRIHLYRTLLAQRRMLVVLDNAANAPQVSDLLPSGARCAALITSRTTLADLAGRRLPLDVLDSATGLALLREMLGPDRTAAEHDSARSIVETCEGLPLAVWVAGARLAARPHWPLARVARALADEQRKLDELAVGHIAVRASLELTYQGMAPTTQHALRMLALLPGPDFAPWALATLLDIGLSDAEGVLDDLVEVHLVEVASAGAAGFRHRLHDLVRLLGRERAEREVSRQERAAALTRLLGASLHLADFAAETLSVDFLGISQMDLACWRLSPTDADQVVADPLAWFNDERRFLIDVVDQALDSTDIASAAGLATALTTLFQVGSHFDDWERVQGRALKTALRAGDRRSATKLHRCLGELTTIVDRYPEALEHFEQALLLAEGEGPAYRASATAGLAYVHRLLGQYSSAVRHFEEACELARSAGNANCLVYATNGIGVIDLELGRVEAAMARFTECLRVSREAGYRPGEAQALRCLGQSHRELGDHPAAADCFRRRPPRSARTWATGSAPLTPPAGSGTSWYGRARRRKGADCWPGACGPTGNSAICGARPRRCTRSRRHSSRPAAPGRPVVAPKPRSGCGGRSAPEPGWPSGSTPWPRHTPWPATPPPRPWPGTRRKRRGRPRATPTDERSAVALTWRSVEPDHDRNPYRPDVVVDAVLDDHGLARDLDAEACVVVVHRIAGRLLALVQRTACFERESGDVVGDLLGQIRRHRHDGLGRGLFDIRGPARPGTLMVHPPAPSSRVMRWSMLTRFRPAAAFARLCAANGALASIAIFHHERITAGTTDSSAARTSP
ncbi:transcriptional regulator, SARP family protein [Streptomyces bingchenggensis BCW-1]|uniref:Transcriptional regulator, SARP family protein n=1 Tax=Streptomyces bingchenggensis (strain BCW-1) TaxID=749414 RepID=D7C5Z7_STRBB|nr:transcriptional regulator, SARP family protein [Streptomyces bingchenggensis BCW-1]